MTLTVEIDPARRTAAFREVSFLAAGDSCRVVLDGVRGADFPTLSLSLYRDAASESPVAACRAFSAVPGHPSLADGELALDTLEMAAWFADAAPEEPDDSDDAFPRASASSEPRLAARASLAERSVRAEGWLVAFDSDRVWAACRVPVLLRPGAGTSGASDPSSIRALVSELVAGLVSAALADKADKVPSAVSGNLASLDSSGNLADSGATPASIKAAAVAEVVANAPGTMDTLKEIADILGSSQQTGTVLKRILDLESGKVDKVQGKGLSANDYTDADKARLDGKRDIGDLLVRAAPTDANGAKFYVDGVATSEYDDSVVGWWIPPGGPVVLWQSAGHYTLQPRVTGAEGEDFALTAANNYSADVTVGGATYHVVGCSDAIARVSEIPDVSVKADKVSGAAAGNLASLTAQGNLADGGVKPSDFATPSDLPYRLVEPGKWGEVAGLPEGVSAPVEYFDDQWYFSVESAEYAGTLSSDGLTLTATVPYEGSTHGVSATRASLPGHLLDRAVNAVSVTGATTLTLPALTTGKSRDFYIKLSLSSAASVSFVAASGENAPSFIPASPSVGSGVWHFTEVVAGTYSVTECGVDYAAVLGDIETALHTINNGGTT